MVIIGWFALYFGLIAAWLLLFAVLANPVLLIPLFALGCLYSGYIHEPASRWVRRHT